MDFLHSSSEKNDVFGDRTSGGAICSSLRPHLLRLYILSCMSLLYGQVFFTQHWVIPEPGPFWPTGSKPNAELPKTGKAAKWGDWDASHPPSQSRSWRTGDNKWRSRVVWGMGDLGRGDWKKKVQERLFCTGVTKLQASTCSKMEVLAHLRDGAFSTLMSKGCQGDTHACLVRGSVIPSSLK